MMRVDEHITCREQRDIFWAEPRVSGKHPNHAKFASEFTRDFWREITVQLNAANSSNVCGFPNVLHSRQRKCQLHECLPAAHRQFAEPLLVGCSAGFAHKSSARSFVRRTQRMRSRLLRL